MEDVDVLIFLKFIYVFFTLFWNIYSETKKKIKISFFSYNVMAYLDNPSNSIQVSLKQ